MHVDREVNVVALVERTNHRGKLLSPACIWLHPKQSGVERERSCCRELARIYYYYYIAGVT
jgi:hypothetical protein